MRRLTPPSGIYVAASKIRGAGRGVFASKEFKPGELIEVSPVVAVPDDQRRLLLRQSDLINYYFLWGKNRKHAAIALGYGSLYNHSYKPNAAYHKKISDDLLEIKSLRKIKEGEEITFNYNGNPKDKSRLWMRDVGPP